ncbi:MAG: ATP-binding protein [candidate division KSB1 bacterium]|nr:ATP-binding protein [candidate division KSB1 bacterium]MDZ7341253.1 ATP-binding protein [candidate division KSB1 bacterium]
MKIFFFWVILIAVLLGVYIWRLLRRFRFQTKLTLIFLLLVLVPAVPLTFVVSLLLTRGVEMFLLPGVENSLSQSLEVIKFQLEQRGELFLKSYPNSSQLNQPILAANEIAYFAKLASVGNTDTPMQWLGHDAMLFQKSPIHSDETRLAIWRGEIKSNIFQVGDQTLCEVYHRLPDSTLQLVAFPLDPQIMAAKNQISESLRLHTFFSLMKKSVVEGQLIWGVAALFVILLAASAVYIANRLSRGISEPIKVLVSGMQQVAAGELATQVQVKAKDEIRFLIDSFNKMTRELKTSQEKLVQAERLAAWQDVARKVSHEIKNALTPIQLSLRRFWNLLPPAYQSAEVNPLAVIQDEVESLRRLAEEFTTFARLPQLQLQPADVNDIIRALVTLIDAEPHGVKLKLNLADNLPLIPVDRDQFRRALHNIIKNGIEASDRGSTILITSERVEQNFRKIRIEIQDHGCGMDGELLSKIFEPYFTTKTRGMGLGLSIVKRIVEDHQGEIQIDSKPGQGTRVVIYL